MKNGTKMSGWRSVIPNNKFQLIGPTTDEILNAISFINQNYEAVKLKPIDWSLLVSGNYTIHVKFEPEGRENRHIPFINKLLSKNNFKCKL
jgi:hypothetical protein